MERGHSAMEREHSVRQRTMAKLKVLLDEFLTNTRASIAVALMADRVSALRKSINRCRSDGGQSVRAPQEHQSLSL